MKKQCLMVIECRAEVFAECSDMKGKLYLSLDSFLVQLVTGFLYYHMSTL
jgi:hypothetical protein